MGWRVSNVPIHVFNALKQVQFSSVRIFLLGSFQPFCRQPWSHGCIKFPSCCDYLATKCVCVYTCVCVCACVREFSFQVFARDWYAWNKIYISQSVLKSKTKSKSQLCAEYICACANVKMKCPLMILSLFVFFGQYIICSSQVQRKQK